MVDAVVQTPAKLNLTNMATNETLFVQFNPTQLTRQVRVNYARQPVLGQSHQPLQYTGTQNQTFTLDMFFDALDVRQRSANPFGEGNQSTAFGLGQEARKFIESLAYPESDENTILSEPPDVLVIWPKTFSMVCKMMAATFKDQRFNREGAVIQFLVSCTFEESRSTRLTSEIIRNLGGFRSKRELGES